MTNKPAWASLRPFKARSFKEGSIRRHVIDDRKGRTLCEVYIEEYAEMLALALNGEGQEPWEPVSKCCGAPMRVEHGDDLGSIKDVTNWHVCTKCDKPTDATPSTPSSCLEALIEDYLLVTAVDGKAERFTLIGAARQEAAGRESQNKDYFGASVAACYLYPGEDEEKLREAFCRGAALAVPPPDRREELGDLDEILEKEFRLGREDRKYLLALINQRISHRSAGLKAEVDVKKCADELLAFGNEVYFYTDHPDGEKMRESFEAILIKYLNRRET